MSDLDDLEEIAGLPEWRRSRRRHRSAGEIETHCKRGHAMTGDNLYVSPKGLRICQKCKRLRLLCRED